MRQRNIKNLEAKIRQNSACLIADPQALRGRWREAFGRKAHGQEAGAACGRRTPLYLEIGCGKGRFIEARAAAFPQADFIAVEGQSNVALRALEKAAAGGHDNLRLFIAYIKDVGDFFAPGELDGIFLNFSDPWPKARHEKRRLTYRDRLKAYKAVLAPGGFVEFKTDNDGLFAFTLQEIGAAGLSILELTYDLAASDFQSRLFTTEYEEKFAAAGKNINYVKFR